MATNDVYELACRQLAFGQQLVNRIHLEANGGFTPDASDALAVANAFKEMLRPTQHQALSYTDWTLRQVWGAGVVYHSNKPIRTGGLVFEGPFTGTLVGTNGSGGVIPLHAAITIKLSSGLSGRRYRGRIYVGCIGADSASGTGAIGSGTVSGLQGTVDTFNAIYKNGGTDPDWNWGIWSFRYASGWRAAAAHPHHLEFVGPISTQNEFTSMVTAKVANVWRSQRRREIGVGS